MTRVLVYNLVGKLLGRASGTLRKWAHHRFRERRSVYFVHTASSFTRVKRISRARDGLLTQDAVTCSGIFTLRKHLLGGCLAWCFRRMGFQALFGDAQGLLVQVGLMGHVPYLGDYHRPEYQQRDRRGDGLLPEDPNPRVHRSPVRHRLYLYVQGGLHANNGLEGPSLADADLSPSRGEVRLGHLEVLLLEVAHHILGDGGDVLDGVGEGLGRVEGSHLKGLLSE